MNAYELADFIDKYCVDNTSKESAVLLRQQADRIAELEKKLQESALDYISVCSQADEHYARVQELEKELSWWRTNFKLPTEPNSPRPNWLYAPQTKPLSDEEIEQIAKQHLAAYAQFIGAGEVCYEGEIEFARAIEERHGIK